MAPPTRTADVGVNQNGEVELYVPPNVVDVTPSVPDNAVIPTYGAWTALPSADDPISLPNNTILQFQNATGLSSTGAGFYRTVTLVPV